MKKYLKYMSPKSELFIINEDNKDDLFRIHPWNFQDKWLLTEREFYTQEFKEFIDGELKIVTYALPW